MRFVASSILGELRPQMGGVSSETLKERNHNNSPIAHIDFPRPNAISYLTWRPARRL